MKREAVFLVWAFLAILAPNLSSADDEADARWSIDPETSLFAVVTHKEGVAAGLAHEHFIVADDFHVSIRSGGLFVDGDDSAGSAEMKLNVEDLLVDDPALASAWQKRLLEQKLIAEPFTELSDKDRQKIRKSMLGEEQLDAESHPTIEASLIEIRPFDDGQAAPRYGGLLSLTVRGETASRNVEFDLEVGEDGSLRAELAASFDFSNFGIEPYKAMFGAIRVADSFDVFVVLRGTRMGVAGR